MRRFVIMALAPPVADWLFWDRDVSLCILFLWWGSCAIVCIVFADLFECVTLDCRLAVILVVFWKKQWQRSLKSF